MPPSSVSKVVNANPHDLHGRPRHRHQRHEGIAPEPTPEPTPSVEDRLADLEARVSALGG